VNGLEIDGSVGVEIYRSYSATVQLSELTQSIKGTVMHNSMLPLSSPGSKWSSRRWWNIWLEFSISPCN